MVQKRLGNEEASNSKSSTVSSCPEGKRSSSSGSKGHADRPPLPSQEELRLYTEGRSPFHCLPCDKRLSKSSLRSHLKNKHPGVVESLSFTCLICSESLTSVGVLNTHSHSELYPCFKCEANKKKDPASFPDFDRLKSHLFNAHNRTQWPWSCSYCDYIAFFELDYIVHLRTHSSKEINNFGCPECQELSSNHSTLREHLVQAHLPHSKKMANDENAVNHEIATLLLNLASRTTTGAPAPPNPSSSAVVAHQQPHQSSLMHHHQSFDKPEDLSKGPQQQAMDLSSKKTPPPLLKLPPTIDTAKLKNMTITPVTTSSGPSALNGSLEQQQVNSNGGGVSSSSSSNGSPGGSLNSSYLLQNLLLGKMAQQHQLIVPGGGPSSSSSAAAAILVPNSTAQHMPKYALKSNGSPHLGSKESIISIPNSSSLSSGSVLGQINNGSSNGSIPLLCGQIVAQLNGLLFLVHDLNSPALENSLQASLGSIYGRLQEIVSLVEQTKTKMDGSSEDLLKHNEIQKAIKESKQKEEDKIAKHIQEYQRALLQQQHSSVPLTAAAAAAAAAASTTTFNISKCPSSSQLPSQILPTLKETLPVAAANSVVTMLKKQGLEATIKFEGVPLSYVTNNNDLLHLPPHSETTVSSSPASSSSSSEHMEVESSTGSGARRRRGRPPKNSGSIVHEGPLEKKFRESPPSLSLKTTSSHQHNIPLHSTPSPVTSPPVNGGAASKGSKGIRNRVFCGECPGCLKNDDCGRCRYCQDKTKFGGQNRLRQKCLHRRCQMDTHRKRASSNATSNNNNNNSNGTSAPVNSSSSVSGANVLPVVTLSMEESPGKLISIPGTDSASATIYSGVDLAKIQENIVINKKPPIEDRVTITNSKTKEEVEIKAILEDAKVMSLKEQVPPASPEASEALSNEKNSKSEPGVLVSSSVSDTKEPNESEEDEDPACFSKGLASSSRIDKWKLKHEAMLKKGENEESNTNKAAAEEESEEELSRLKNSPSPEGNSLCIDFEPPEKKNSSALSVVPSGPPSAPPSNPPVNQAVLTA